MESENISTSLLSSIISEDLKEIVIDASEVTLDTFLNEGVLKEIPFFGTLYKGFKTALSIRETIFAKKIYNFLYQLREIPTEKRIEFIKKLDNDEEYQKKVGEKIMVLIEHLDDIDKSKIIGILLKSSIEEKISFETFLRLSAIVDRAFLPDLLKLRPGNRKKGITKLVEEQFYMLGIMSLTLEENKRDKYIMSMASLGGNGNNTDLPPIVKYEINKLGETLIKNIFLQDK